MALDSYGYREGPRMLVYLPVDSSTSDITAGDILTWGTAGYVQQAAADDNSVAGVAAQSVASPGSDGAVSILVDISELSIYEFPPDSGTVTQAIVGKTMDVGGARSIKIAASADDVVRCVRVDTDANTAFVMFKTVTSYGGVA